jgi:serine/threonine protein kinase
VKFAFAEVDLNRLICKTSSQATSFGVCACSMIGKTLAHYEIASQLGKGGMREGYRAHDTKLNRDVALKVLPPEELAKAVDRIARSKFLYQYRSVTIGNLYGSSSIVELSF